MREFMQDKTGVEGGDQSLYSLLRLFLYFLFFIRHFKIKFAHFNKHYFASSPGHLCTVYMLPKNF